MKSMKKIKFIPVILIVTGLVISGASYAQSHRVHGPGTPVEVGSVTLNVGIGVGAAYRNDYCYNTPFGTKVAAEWGLWQAGPGVITLGPEIGGSFSNGGYYDNSRSRTIIIAGRSAWHYGWGVP